MGVVVGWLLVIFGCGIAVSGFTLTATWLSVVGLGVGFAGSVIVAVSLRGRSVR